MVLGRLNAYFQESSGKVGSWNNENVSSCSRSIKRLRKNVKYESIGYISPVQKGIVSIQRINTFLAEILKRVGLRISIVIDHLAAFCSF